MSAPGLRIFVFVKPHQNMIENNKRSKLKKKWWRKKKTFFFRGVWKFRHGYFCMFLHVFACFCMFFTGLCMQRKFSNTSKKKSFQFFFIISFLVYLFYGFLSYSGVFSRKSFFSGPPHSFYCFFWQHACKYMQHEQKHANIVTKQ